MMRKQFFIGWICVLGLLLLSSCGTYQRNYPGPLLPEGEVAFLFRDSVDTFGLEVELTSDSAPAENTPISLKNIIQLSGILPKPSSQPNCLEITAGEYLVKAWATESSKDHFKKYGPYDFIFEAQGGHFYRVDAQKKYQEKKKLWFLSLKLKPYYEIYIEDITSSGAYQGFLEELERK